MPLTRFENGQRVRVSELSLPAVDVRAIAALAGQTGTVRRLRREDVGAWVEMDRDLPDDLRRFPVDDARARHVKLYPDECEALEPQEAS